MVSEMAMEDIEALRAEGVELSPREIIRLNALGLRVQRAQRCAEFAVLPRVAFLGGLVLHEPTIADEIWLAETGRLFDLDDMETVALLQGVCLSTSSDDLPTATDRNAVMAAIDAFRAGPAARHTLDQLLSALAYVLYGNDASRGERPPPKEGEQTEAHDRGDVSPFVAGVLRDGLALRLGSPADLCRMRASQLLAVAEMALGIQEGASAQKAARSEALGDYCRALDAITAAHKEDSNG